MASSWRGSPLRIDRGVGNPSSPSLHRWRSLQHTLAPAISTTTASSGAQEHQHIKGFPYLLITVAWDFAILEKYSPCAENTLHKAEKRPPTAAANATNATFPGKKPLRCHPRHRSIATAQPRTPATRLATRYKTIRQGNNTTCSPRVVVYNVFILVLGVFCG